MHFCCVLWPQWMLACGSVPAHPSGSHSSVGSLQPSGFHQFASFVWPLGFYLYADPSGLLGFHLSAMRRVYASHSSPYSFSHLLKSSFEVNAWVSDRFSYWCTKTFRSPIWLMAWVRPLDVAGLRSLCLALGALGWLLFVPH